MKKMDREVEKGYSGGKAALKLRRLADSLERGGSFRIQIGGERISVPAGAEITFEHEREGTWEELEIQLKWKRT